MAVNNWTSYAMRVSEHNAGYFDEYLQGVKFTRIFFFWLDESPCFQVMGNWLFFWNCWWQGASRK